MTSPGYWTIFAIAVVVCGVVGWLIGREAAKEAQREKDRWRRFNSRRWDQ
jgi:hypothetical protein